MALVHLQGAQAYIVMVETHIACCKRQEYSFFWAQTQRNQHVSLQALCIVSVMYMDIGISSKSYLTQGWTRSYQLAEFVCCMQSSKWTSIAASKSILTQCRSYLFMHHNPE